jgi:hypothetical protein
MEYEIFNIYYTRRDKMCVSINNFKFSKNRELKSGNFLFRCTNKKCKSVATFNSQCTIIINYKNGHNHSEYSQNEVHKDIIRSSVKRKAIEDMHTQPSKIIRQELLLKSDLNLNHGDIHLLLLIQCMQQEKNIFRNSQILLTRLYNS